MSLEEKVEKLSREMEELKEEKRELEREVKELKKSKDIEKKQQRPEEKDISRRSFLKKMGAGAAGIGALSLAPAASQLKLTKNGISGSTLETVNSKLDMKGNSIENASRINFSVSGDAERRQFSQTLSDGESSNFASGGEYSEGLILLHDRTNRETAAFLLAENYAATVGNSGGFSTTEGNSGTINLWANSSSNRHRIENLTGSSVTYHAFLDRLDLH